MHGDRNGQLYLLSQALTFKQYSPQQRWRRRDRRRCSYTRRGAHSAATPSPHLPLFSPHPGQNSEGSASRSNPVEFTAFPLLFIFPAHVLLCTAHSWWWPLLCLFLSFFPKISNGRGCQLSDSRSSSPVRTPNVYPFP